MQAMKLIIGLWKQCLSLQTVGICHFWGLFNRNWWKEKCFNCYPIIYNRTHKKIPMTIFSSILIKSYRNSFSEKNFWSSGSFLANLDTQILINFYKSPVMKFRNDSNLYSQLLKPWQCLQEKYFAALFVNWMKRVKKHFLKVTKKLQGCQNQKLQPDFFLAAQRHSIETSVYFIYMLVIMYSN